MIVTFHLAVILAYHVWETITEVLFGNNDNPQDRDDTDSIQPDNVSTKTVSKQASNLNLEANLGLPFDEVNFNPSDAMSKNVDQLLHAVGGRQLMTSEGDTSPIINQIDLADRDKGKELIYDVEPTFECNFKSEEKGIRFIPPVYVQRYMAIEKILKEPCWSETVKKIVDFGCAELSFEFKHLKKIFGIHEIVAVDVDSELLKIHGRKVSPTHTDYLQLRPSPLTVKVFCGSVGTTHEALAKADAVIAIELIEHLFPPDLECLPFTIFGFIKPKIAMFTTPNADFNVLFPNFSGFRHDDHKFEWSRDQFEDWCNNLVQRYPDYTVTFKGVGPGPVGTEHLGCCSQMATFVKVYDSHCTTADEMHIQDGEYTLVEEFVYPFFVDTRTREEKIRDDAVSFLQRCVLLRRLYDRGGDEDDDGKNNKEISLNAVMERIKCYNREKLRNILLAENWEIKGSPSHEVIILPDSDCEEEDLSEENISEKDENDSVDCSYSLTKCSENWDCYEETEPKEFLNSTSNVDCLCDSVENVPTLSDSVVTVGLESSEHSSNQTSNFSGCGNNDGNSSHTEMLVPNTLCVTDSCSFNHKSEISFETDLECSVYKTPFNNGCKTPNSTLNTSFYTTPCCSQLHKAQIPKCLSLQQINGHFSSPSLQNEMDITKKDQHFTQEPKDHVSRSMEGLINQDSCDMHESFSNASKIVDSGYCPDSYSEHDMDLDMTPQLIDEIESESEGNESGSLPSPHGHAALAPLLLDDVQNGDVVNNNRDGEGNNVVVDMEEEPLQFEAQIEEVNGEVLNFAAVEKPNQDHKPEKENCHNCQELRNREKFEAMNQGFHVANTKIEEDSVALRLINLDNESKLKNTQSDLSVATSMASSQSNFIEHKGFSNLSEDENKTSVQSEPCKRKSYNSLTTVLDGCSKFSECSLVRPHVFDKAHCSDLEKEDLMANNKFPKWLLKIGNEECDSTEDADNQSVLSDYCSAESLTSATYKDNVDCPKFPPWLLSIEVNLTENYDTESRRSILSLLDDASYEEEEEEHNFDVQVDARGGGDPIRGTWL